MHDSHAPPHDGRPQTQSGDCVPPSLPRTIQLVSVNIHFRPMPLKPGSNPNNSPVGRVVQYGESKPLASGDSEHGELRHFVQSRSVPDVPLLKPPPHGSDDAVEQHIARMPEVIAISFGSKSHVHPKPSAVYTYNGSSTPYPTITKRITRGPCQARPARSWNAPCGRSTDADGSRSTDCHCWCCMHALCA